MLRFFGRGSAFADTHNSAYFIHEGNLVLVDCSMDAYFQIKNADLKDVNSIYILVTHTHSDHIAGIPLLIDYEFFNGKIPVIVVAPSEEVKKDLLYLIANIDGCDESWYTLDVFENTKKNLSCLTNVIPTKHAVSLDGKCFGYELNIDGKQVVYTGDTSTIVPFLEIVQDGSSFYVEVNSSKSKVHLYIDEIIEILKELTLRNIDVYLMHLDNEEKILEVIAGTDIKLAPVVSIDEKANNANEMLDTIYSISSGLYENIYRNLDDTHLDVFENLTKLGTTIGQCDRASFWKWDKRKGQLWTTSATGIDRIVISDKSGLVGKAISTKEIVITNDPYNHPDFNSVVDKETGYVTKSVMVLPVADVNGNFIGAYQLINKLDNKGFTREDARRLSLAALICGLALESETYLDDSHHDKLTGLKNRMGFYYDFSHIYSRYMSDSNLKMSFFICDVDKFKAVNDTYGHNAGDDVLKSVANLLSGLCTENQNIYRWGGEEFIMIMPDMELSEAVEKADEIRRFIMNTPINADGNMINKTVSFGCSIFDSSKTIEENVSIADRYLYIAKDTGRNKVVYSEE